MLRPDREMPRVYLHRAPVDMRKQMDGLAILAKEVIQQDPTSGALFAFINQRRNKLKLLVWERNGFIVWYKRLERDKFHWPRQSDEPVITLVIAVTSTYLGAQLLARSIRWEECGSLTAYVVVRKIAHRNYFVNRSFYYER